MRRARARPLEELLLSEDLEDRVTRPAREQTLEPFGIRLPGANQLGQTKRARTRDGEDGDGEDERWSEPQNSVQSHKPPRFGNGLKVIVRTT